MSIVGVCEQCGRRAAGTIAEGRFLCVHCTGPSGGGGPTETHVERGPDEAELREAA